MKRQSAHRKKLVRVTAMLSGACATFLFVMSATVQAQNPAQPSISKGADAAGVVVAPPMVDPGMSKAAPPTPDSPAVRPPPMNIEPEAVRKPHPKSGNDKGTGKTGKEASRNGKSNQSGTGSSAKDACQGPAELCKQDSAR
jgi:hypothetical protein